MIVEVFVAEGDAEDALCDQGSQVVFDLGWVSRVRDGVGQGLRETDPAVDLAEQEGSGVGGESAAVEIGDDLLLAKTGKEQRFAGTLCHRMASLPCGRNS